MRDALMAVVAELRAARPGPFADALSWEDLQADRAAVAEELPDVWSLAELRVHGFARTLQRRRDAEGGDEAADEVLARQVGASYFAHRDRDPALFPDTFPASTPCGPTTGWVCSPTGAGYPRRSAWPATSRRSSSRRTTAWPSPTRGSSRWSSASSASGPRCACSWATTRSTTWPARTAPAGARCGSTATAPCPSPMTARQPDAVVRTLTELPGVLRRLG